MKDKILNYSQRLFVLFASIYSVILISGCATVLESSLHSKIESTGMIPESEVYEVHDVSMTSRPQSGSEEFRLDGVITRYWEEGRAEKFWRIMKVRRNVQVWQDGRHPRAVVNVQTASHSGNREGVRSMYYEPRVSTERYNLRDVPLEPVKHSEPAHVPIPLQILKGDGMLLSQTQLRPRETLILDLLEHGYPFRDDLHLTFILDQSSMRIPPPGRFNFTFTKQELINRYVASGQSRGSAPNLTVSQARGVEHVDDPKAKMEGGDTVSLLAEVRNARRAGDAHSTRVLIYDADLQSVLAESETIMSLQPGQRHQVPILLNLDFARSLEERLFLLVAEDGFGGRSPVSSVRITVQPTSSIPQLQILNAVVQQSKEAERISVAVLIRNRGSRAADSVTAEVTGSNPAGVFSLTNLEVGRVDAHSQKQFLIPVEKSRIGEEGMTFQLRIRERMGISEDEKQIVLPGVLFRAGM